MPGLKRWIQCCRGINSPLVSVINAPLEINTLFGVVLVAHHFGVDAGKIEVGGLVFAAACDDHLGFSGLSKQRLHNWLNGQEL